jgi:hypothetical protein
VATRAKVPGPHACRNLHTVGKEAMNDVSRQRHWENVYATKGESEVSWFQETPALSLELIGLVGAIRNSAVIDIGGGASGNRFASRKRVK